MRALVQVRAGLPSAEPAVLPEREFENGAHGPVLPPFALGAGGGDERLDQPRDAFDPTPRHDLRWPGQAQAGVDITSDRPGPVALALDDRWPSRHVPIVFPDAATCLRRRRLGPPEGMAPRSHVGTSKESTVRTICRSGSSRWWRAKRNRVSERLGSSRMKLGCFFTTSEICWRTELKFFVRLNR